MANISSFDNVTYTLTGDINGSVIIDRNHIVLDGAGYIIHGNGSNDGISNYLGLGLNNVTIRNVNIDNVDRGIFVVGSSNVKIIGNSIINVANIGIHIYGSSSDNEVVGNYLENISMGYPPNGAGIHIEFLSHRNNVSGNWIANCEQGVFVSGECHDNIVSLNDITGADKGIQLHFDASYGSITQNWIVGNEYGISTGGYLPCVNNSVNENVIMDNGYGLYFPSFVNNTICRNYFINNIYNAFAPPILLPIFGIVQEKETIGMTTQPNILMQPKLITQESGTRHTSLMKSTLTITP